MFSFTPAREEVFGRNWHNRYNRYTRADSFPSVAKAVATPVFYEGVTQEPRSFTGF